MSDAHPSREPSTKPVEQLFDGPVDIVGDLHGEFDALGSLLAKLGYDADGRHPDGRRLVFVGDLIDRGPDSPGVLRAVIRMVEAGNAQCVIGNHELNALRDDPHRQRPGEGWWYARNDRAHRSVVVSAEEKERSFVPFLRSLPAALERDDLRVVHACWHEESIAKLRASESLFAYFQDEQLRLAEGIEELEREAAAALSRIGANSRRRFDHREEFPYVPELADLECAKQMRNAAKVVTSGVEQPAGQSFYASGKWRVVGRVPWWDQYSDAPVVVGHYWRRYHTNLPHGEGAADLDMFGDTPANAWLGAARRVMCIDYSAGYRFRERASGRTAPFDHCLAALRIPEWELVFDDERPALVVEPPA